MYTKDFGVFVQSELSSLTSAVETKLDSQITKNAPWSSKAQSKLSAIVETIWALSKKENNNDNDYYFEKKYELLLKYQSRNFYWIKLKIVGIQL